MAHTRHGHRGELAVLVDENFENRSPGGGHRFPFDAGRHHRRSAQQFECGGGREGKPTVRGLDGPVAEGHRAGADAAQAEPVDGDRGAGDVDDGVDRADFVEMHLVRGHPVHHALRHRQGVEHRERPPAHRGAERRAAQQTADVFVVTPVAPTLRPGHAHVEVGRRNGTPRHAPDDKGVRDVERSEVFAQGAARETRIEHRREEHVAGDPREAIEVEQIRGGHG